MPFKLTPDKQAKLSENDVEEACLDFLRLRGYRIERLHVGLFRSADCKRWIKGAPKGTPDYVTAHARYPGFYLETKRPKGKLSLDQERVIWEITTAFRIAVATIDRVESLIPWLDAHEKGSGL